jgi:hypothetical protein
LTLQPSSTVPVIEAAAVLEERLIKVVDIERIGRVPAVLEKL